jgi:hypothetical protein
MRFLALLVINVYQIIEEHSLILKLGRNFQNMILKNKQSLGLVILKFSKK